MITLATGQGCPCGLHDSDEPRPTHVVERTTSYRHRAGSRRAKRLARGRQAVRVGCYHGGVILAAPVGVRALLRTLWRWSR